MSQFGLTRSALVISTTPPVPREYGNRNRVFQTISFLRQAGFTISFLLYAFDEEWEKSIPAYYPDLVAQFDYFAVVPNSRRLHQQAAGFHHGIDEWWDDTIGQKLTWLFQRKSFDLLFVNYTFLSKAFTYAPRNTLRVLDTHDIFTGRREGFAKYGVEPEFFYTNAAEERIAFDRADAVIAIKVAEADFIRSLTTKHVVNIPYWDSNPVQPPEPRQGPPPVFSHDRPLRLGFIGAQNSVNVVNMRRFLKRFSRYVQLYNLPVEVVVAGNVCRQLHDDYPFLKKLGRVETIGEFYRNVDVIVAPLEFSTGIKIKVGEALVWQLPVMATHNAFDGFRSFHRTQSEKSVAALCRSVAALAYNEIPFPELVMATRHAARAALKAQEKGFSELRAWIKSSTRRILFVTDRPFWYRGTFIDEMITQALEYVSHLAPVVVAVVGWKGVQPAKVYADVRYIELGEVNALPNLLAELMVSSEIAGSVTFLDDSSERVVMAALAQNAPTVWRGRLARDASDNRLGFQVGDRSVIASPLRYAPVKASQPLSDSHVAIFSSSTPTEWEAIVLEYVTEAASANNLTAIAVTVPPYSEYDPAFLHAAMGNRASRIIMLAADAAARLFLLQASHYRGVSCLIIGEEYIYPQAVGPDGESPSIAESINLFLKEPHARNVASGANSGWSRVWAGLEATVAKAA